VQYLHCLHVVHLWYSHEDCKKTFQTRSPLFRCVDSYGSTRSRLASTEGAYSSVPLLHLYGSQIGVSISSPSHKLRFLRSMDASGASCLGGPCNQIVVLSLSSVGAPVRPWTSDSIDKLHLLNAPFGSSTRVFSFIQSRSPSSCPQGSSPRMHGFLASHRLDLRPGCGFPCSPDDAIRCHSSCCLSGRCFLWMPRTSLWFPYPLSPGLSVWTWECARRGVWTLQGPIDLVEAPTHHERERENERDGVGGKGDPKLRPHGGGGWEPACPPPPQWGTISSSPPSNRPPVFAGTHRTGQEVPPAPRSDTYPHSCTIQPSLVPPFQGRVSGSTDPIPSIRKGRSLLSHPW